MANLKGKYLPLFWIIVLSTGLILGSCQRRSSRRFRGPNYYRVTSDNLHSVVAVDAKQAWVIGSFGAIFYTSDGGKTWKSQDSKGEEQLCKGYFVDAQNGWIIGSNGTILHTEDGGKTWLPQKSPTKLLLLNAHFIDTKNGWIVGEQGTILHTLDGGKTWEDRGIEHGPVLNGVSFADLNNGWIVGDYGTILHTEDGGNTWGEQDCQDIVPVIEKWEWGKPLPALFDVDFIDENRGWIAGIEGIILFTEDRGKHWKKLETNTKMAIYAVEVKGNRGWAIGDKGTYLLSKDGGLSWKLMVDAIKTRKWLRDVSFFDEGIGWTVGARGTVVKTEDGGEHWEMLSGRSYETPTREKMPLKQRG